MPSFREIRRHGSVLLIDAASATIQVGLLGADGIESWATSPEESGIGIFKSATQLAIVPASIDAFVYCEGPGSVLGIRTSAMALRTWCMLKPRPIYAYTSLAVVAHALGRSEVGVIADARRDLWHHYQLGHGLRRMPTGDLSGKLVMPAGFRHWTQLPPKVETCTYALADILPQIDDAELLRATDAPDAFLHEEPSYLTWTPQIHRSAPTP
ncbi:MAG: peptidase M22 [Opitutaceae bacterium]